MILAVILPLMTLRGVEVNPMKNPDIVLLERFVLDNPDLERLEAILDDFNPFVAMRWTRQETRHSNFLRWLLDPNETHGLGSYFLRQFMKYVASRSPQRTMELPSVVDLDSYSYSATQVQVEWNSIDLMVRDDALKLVTIIENKVDSSEHGEQLQRYRSVVERHFPSYKKLYVYLTIDGDAPSDESFVSLTYAEIIRLIEETISRRHDQLNPSVAEFMGAYVEMLRRHIVEDSEIQKLSEKIYKTHRRALDILFELRADRASEIKEYLLHLISTMSQLEQDSSTKSYIRFIPKIWDFLPKHGEGWTPSKRLLLVEIDQSGGPLKLKLILGPGRSSTREALHKFIAKNTNTFNRASTKLYPQWWSFHIENWIPKKQYEESDIEEIKEQIRTRFENFVLHDLMQFSKSMENLREASWGD